MARVAKIVCDNIRNIPDYQNKTIVFPDSGFPNELVYLTAQFQKQKLFWFEFCVMDATSRNKMIHVHIYHIQNLIVDNNKDETNIPKEHRGHWMLEQYLNKFH